MPLEAADELLSHASRGRYAVGYFESWDIASLEGVIDAAEQSRAPVIVGFNGEFLARPERDPPARLEWYGALGRAAAESARVPCAVMFNECAAVDWVERATGLGFNLVMFADEKADHAALTRRVAELVRVAHGRGVAVEAELGVLPCGVASHNGTAAALTDPDQAAAFVRATRIDVLAVSTGNVHIKVDGQQSLDLAHLAAIHKKVHVPLALHGGSGIVGQSLADAIALGVAKVNYGTYLKQRCLAAVRRALAEADGNANPHRVLGGGGGADLLVTVRQAVRDAVLERIGLLGCCGKA
ncbi:MAG: class II fructose-bisphosphate aldolase [Thermoguttaceae bacterium]